MNTAILFSGGKDSCLALSYALESSDVKCLIIMISKNTESYMFHTPNIKWAEKQAKAIGIPVLIHDTQGIKEDELDDLTEAITAAISKYHIQGIYTGAIASVYQASRIQKICDNLGIECINPLWQKDQIGLLKELVEKDFEVIIVGTFGYGLDNFIGRKIDEKFIEEIADAKARLKINPAGEGGEFESFTLNTPFFKKRLEITKSHIAKDKEGGQVMVIDELDFNQ
jgi:diphthine-ammonia ligase